MSNCHQSICRQLPPHHTEMAEGWGWGVNGRVCMCACEGASEGVVMTSLATSHHWEVNSAGIPKCCAIRAVMTWCSSGTVCSWDPRAFGNTACLSALLLTGSRSVHVCAYVCLRAYVFAWPTYAQDSCRHLNKYGTNSYENWKKRNIWLMQRHKGQKEWERTLWSQNGFTLQWANEKVS